MFSVTPKNIFNGSENLNVNWITIRNACCKQRWRYKESIAFEENFMALEDSFIIQPNLRGMNKGI